MAEEYRSAATLSKFVGADVVTKAGQFNKLGEYKVQAGEYLVLGYGSDSGQANSDGRIFCDLKSIEAGNPSVDGTIRFSIYSAQDRPLLNLAEFEVATLRYNESDRSKQISFPRMSVGAGEDKKFVIEFRPNADATVDKETSKMLFDFTQGVVN